MMPRKSVQFVVKISKYCNLRCSYCYEFNELGNKAKIEIDNFVSFFSNVRRYALANDLDSVSFIWHGGEPLLIKLDYYREIGKIQKDIFGDEIRFWNSVQTNLTILTKSHIDFLKSKEFFSCIGVSFDVFGDQRVDIKGALRTDVVLKNMQTLIDQRIGFGAISVLARNTLDHVAEIYRFYDELGVECRFLPFYRSANDQQIESHSLSSSEIVAALKLIFDKWLASPRSTLVDPVDDYIDYAIKYLKNSPKYYYDKFDDESVFIVNVDGATWGVSETYDPKYTYGNLFQQELGAILSSPERTKAVAESKARMKAHCVECPYYGYCPGDFIADATTEQIKIASESGCPVRELISYIVDKLQKSEMADFIREHEQMDRDKNPALSIDL